MNQKSSVLLMRSLVVVASIVTASLPTVGNHGASGAPIPDQARVDHPASAPTVVAQGRCYNGRCY